MNRDKGDILNIEEIADRPLVDDEFIDQLRSVNLYVPTVIERFTRNNVRRNEKFLLIRGFKQEGG